MATIDEAIITHLEAQSGLTVLVSQRIRFDQLDQGEILPAVVIKKNSGCVLASPEPFVITSYKSLLGCAWSSLSWPQPKRTRVGTCRLNIISPSIDNVVFFCPSPGRIAYHSSI